jgi:hypothetical protein
MLGPVGYGLVMPWPRLAKFLNPPWLAPLRPCQREVDLACRLVSRRVVD